MAQQVKDSASSLLWLWSLLCCRFDLWLMMQPKKKKKDKILLFQHVINVESKKKYSAFFLLLNLCNWCVFLTAHLNSNDTFSSEILDLCLDFIKFVFGEVDSYNPSHPNSIE